MKSIKCGVDTIWESVYDGIVIQVFPVEVNLPMLLFFHKGLQDGAPVLVTGSFSKHLDTDVYASVVFEDDDNLSEFSVLRVECLAGPHLVCQHEWNLTEGFTSFHLWFDLARIANLHEHEKVILTAQAYLGGSVVLRHHAFVETGKYFPVQK